MADLQPNETAGVATRSIASLLLAVGVALIATIAGFALLFRWDSGSWPQPGVTVEPPSFGAKPLETSTRRDLINQRLESKTKEDGASRQAILDAKAFILERGSNAYAPFVVPTAENAR